MGRPSDNRCDPCARGGIFKPIHVRPLRPDVPDVGSLRLCRTCAGPHGTWRYRWAPLS